MNRITEVARSLFQRAWMRNIGLGVSRWPKHSPACCFLAIAVMDPQGCEEGPDNAGDVNRQNIQVPVPLGPNSDHIRSFQVIHRNGIQDAVSVVTLGITFPGDSILHRNFVIYTEEKPSLRILELPSRWPALNPSNNSPNEKQPFYLTGDFNEDSFIDIIGINRSSAIYFHSGNMVGGNWYLFSDLNFRPCSMQFVQGKESEESYLLLVGTSGRLKTLQSRERNNGETFPFSQKPVDATGIPIEFEHHIDYITRGGELIAISTSTCEALDKEIENRSREFENKYLDDNKIHDRITIKKNRLHDAPISAAEEDRECEKYGESCAYIQWNSDTTNDGPKQYLDIQNPARLAVGNFFVESDRLDLAITQSNTIIFFENLGNQMFKKRSDKNVKVNYGHPHETIDKIRAGKFDDENVDDLAVLKQQQGVVTLVLSGGKL